jgi:phosphate transport system substrate-binding protein
MKKIAKIVLVLALAAVMALNVSAAASFSRNRDITVVSRENGSGTRGAFIELFGVLEKDANGEHDRTSKEAVIANTTELVFTNVSGDPHAIGYVSLGSLNSTVKAVQIDGVNATIDNVKNKTYKVSRPFIITTKKTVSAITRDFYDFIFSKEGQAVLANGYIPALENAPAYASKRLSGRVVVAGSSSVTPIMEKVAEAYEALNPGANVEIQMSDSGAGIKATIDGVCDMGMASRELKPEERETIYNYRIARVGIAVVANKLNPLTSLTSAQVKDVFTGKTASWSDLV